MEGSEFRTSREDGREKMGERDLEVEIENRNKGPE